MLGNFHVMQLKCPLYVNTTISMVSMLRLSFNAVNVMVKLGINHKDKKNLFIFTVLQSSSNTTLKSLLVFDLTKSSGALVSRSAG